MSRKDPSLPVLPAPLTPLALVEPAEAAVETTEPGDGSKPRRALRKVERRKSDGQDADVANVAEYAKHSRSSTPDNAGTDDDKAAKPGIFNAQFHFGRAVKPQVLMAFSRQLASFLEAGIPVLEALEIVATETDSSEMKTVVLDMRAAVQRGTSFVDAVAAHPTVFPGYYRAMVMSAEFTGRLDLVLDQLAVYLERDIAARRQVKSALTYPIIVLVVACAAMVVMSVFVLPKFSGLYRSLGAKLPLPTRILLGFTDFMTGSWPLILGGGAALLLTVVGVFGGERSKSRRDRLAMRLPVVGSPFHLISLERFCRVLAALATAGIPLPDAIDVSADSTNNSIFQAKMAIVRETVVRGGGFYNPMLDSGIFPIAARQMIRVGEKTGSLGQQLSKAATYYEREVSFHIKRATDLFEPTVILVVGVVVGFIAVAQVAAMYSIFGQIH